MQWIGGDVGFWFYLYVGGVVGDENCYFVGFVDDGDWWMGCVVGWVDGV